MSDTETRFATIGRADIDRLNRISMEAHGVTGMLDAVLLDTARYSIYDLIGVIKTAHDRLETACRR